MQTCPTCGLIATDSASSCEQCGQRFQAANAVQSKAPDALLLVAKDIRMIRNIAIGWAVGSLIAGLLGLFLWMAQADQAQRATQRYEQLLDKLGQKK